MTDEGYNGWSNWETYNAAVWPMNEESIWDWIRHLAIQDPLTAETAEEVIREFYPEGTPDMDSAADYDKVDWDEIAEAFNE